MNTIVKKRAEKFFNDIADNWSEETTKKLIEVYEELDYYDIPNSKIENIFRNIFNSFYNEVEKKNF